ncbi:MAG: AI-2E family transporter [Candidatus Dojkabacteria bacterium]|jgi:predicted PurR-regulated permease PerM|nr:AI-2E family transporter [Candidatus Dojkabacteria bacterium]MDD2270461.1 AI-2E family transporter [Candidatus Dojkabacteria bacterium]
MEDKKYFQKKNSKIAFGVLAIVLFGLAIYVASPYINIIILSIIVSYTLQPIYKFLTKKLKTKRVSASLLSTALTVLFTLIIGLLLIVALVNIASIVLEQVNNLKVENNSTMDYLNDAINWLNIQLQNLNIPVEITLQEVVANLRNSIAAIANNVLSAVSSIGTFSIDIIFKLTIFYGLTYTIIPNFDKFINFIKKLSPFEEEITSLYIDRTLKTAKAMAWGMLLVSISQGLSAGIVFYFLGTPYLFLIILLVTIVSFIPLLATGLITFPIGLIYILNGQIWKGIVVIVYQLIVVGNIDGILRAKLIPKDVRMPMFISFVAIFGGLALWGIWGLIYGPVGFILLLTTVEVIQKYYIPSKE